MAAKIIAVSNQKGGVGKTTASVNLISCLLEEGNKVLAIDNDPQGDLTTALAEDKVFSINESPNACHTISLYTDGAMPTPEQVSDNLWIFGSSKLLIGVEGKGPDTWFLLADNIEKIANELGVDYVVIDCLPSMSMLQTAAHIASDYIVIPTSLDRYGIKSVREQLRSIDVTQRRMNNKLKIAGILFNAVNIKQLTNVESIYLDEFESDPQLAPLVLKSKIGKSIKFSEANALSVSMLEYKGSSDLASHYREFTKELLTRIEGGE